MNWSDEGRIIIQIILSILSLFVAF